MDDSHIVSGAVLRRLTPDCAVIDVPSTVCFAKKGEFVTRTIAGETILVPIRGQVGDLDSIYNLNEVGTFIWERIDGLTNVKQLADLVAANFEVALEEAESDTVHFVRGLEAAAIVRQNLEGG